MRLVQTVPAGTGVGDVDGALEGELEGWADGNAEGALEEKPVGAEEGVWVDDLAGATKAL